MSVAVTNPGSFTSDPGADYAQSLLAQGLAPPDLSGAAGSGDPLHPDLHVAATPTGQWDINGTTFETIWQDDFQTGPGHLTRQWGDVTWSPGKLTLKSSPDFSTDAGAMVPPTGPDGSEEYGLYQYLIGTQPGDVPGPYALIWPRTDVWPGPELDAFEITRSGEVYSTVHWKAPDGSNAFASHTLPGVSAANGAEHLYGLDWEGAGNALGVAPYLDVYVDGVRLAHITDHIPADFAHGGEDGAPGVGMQTWWSKDAQHALVNQVEVYSVSYLAPVAAGLTPEQTWDSTVSGPAPTAPTGNPPAPVLDPGSGATVVTPAAAPFAPQVLDIGAGAHALSLHISQDFFEGSAQYKVTIDGNPIGGTYTASALHGSGQSDVLTVHGDLAPGPHSVEVTFLNDAYAASPLWATDPAAAMALGDRSLHVDAMTYDGVAVPGGAQDIWNASYVHPVAFGGLSPVG